MERAHLNAAAGARTYFEEEDEGEEGLWFEKGPPQDFDLD